MGGVAVLQPQTCLKDRLPQNNLIYSPMKPRPNPSRSPHPNPNSTRSNLRRRSPTGLGNQPAKNLVMGQVKILKRGEAFTETPETKDDDALVENDVIKVEDLDDMVLSSTDRLGPEPEMVPKQIRLSDFYAGSAVIVSPPPSSVPLPAFFTKKGVFPKKDDPTSDLRRMLGLDLQ